MTRATALRLGTLGALLGALLSVGCSSTSTCNRDEDTVDFYGGRVSVDRTTYESSEQNVGNLIYFPPNRTLVLHFGPKPESPDDPPVGLLDAPAVFIFLSFTEHPGSTIASNAGNGGLIRVTTADRTEIHNDTCSDYYVWVYATTAATPFEPISSGGASDATSEPASSGNGGAAGAAP